MAVPASAALDHLGPWTEEDFFALPVDRRIELLDGSLLVGPSGSHRHQWLSSRLWAALNEPAPDGMRALEAVNIRVGPGKILIPDIALIADADMSATFTDAEKVAAIIEITSPSNAYIDRGVKPALYAAAGIRTFVRIDLVDGTPEPHVFQLVGDGYREVRQAGDRPGELSFEHPFPVSLDLSELL